MRAQTPLGILKTQALLASIAAGAAWALFIRPMREELSSLRDRHDRARVVLTSADQARAEQSRPPTERIDRATRLASQLDSAAAITADRTGLYELLRSIGASNHATIDRLEARPGGLATRPEQLDIRPETRAYILELTGSYASLVGVVHDLEHRCGLLHISTIRVWPAHLRAGDDSIRASLEILAISFNQPILPPAASNVPADATPPARERRP